MMQSCQYLSQFKITKKTQNDKLETLSAKAQELESGESYNYDENEEYDYDDLDNEEGGKENDNAGTSTSDTPGTNRKADDENNNTSSRFYTMAKRFKIKEVCDINVDDTLAKNVTDLFRNGMDEDQYNDLTKDENAGRPENYEGLTVVRTNQLVWDLIGPNAQQNDKKLQSVVKSVTIITVVL